MIFKASSLTMDFFFPPVSLVYRWWSYCVNVPSWRLNKDFWIPIYCLTFLTGLSAGSWSAPTPTVRLTFTLRTTFILMLKQATHTPDLSGTEARALKMQRLRAQMCLVCFFWICVSNVHGVKIYISALKGRLNLFWSSTLSLCVFAWELQLCHCGPTLSHVLMLSL